MWEDDNKLWVIHSFSITEIALAISLCDSAPLFLLYKSTDGRMYSESQMFSKTKLKPFYDGGL